MKKKSLTLSPGANETVQGWVYLLLQMTVLPYVLASLFPSAFWINFAYYCCNFAACGWIFRDFLRKNLAQAGKKPTQFCFASLLGFLLAMGGNWVLGWVFRRLVPGFSNLNDASVQALVVQNRLLMTLAVVGLVPLAEECIFRGLLFSGLHSGSRILAYGLSMGLFCAVHILGHLSQGTFLVLLCCFLQYIPAAFALCWAYERSDSIFCPILIHAAVNAVGILSWR